LRIYFESSSVFGLVFPFLVLQHSPLAVLCCDLGYEEISLATIGTGLGDPESNVLPLEQRCGGDLVTKRVVGHVEK